MFGNVILAGQQGPSEKGLKNHQHQNKTRRYRKRSKIKKEIREKNRRRIRTELTKV